MPHIIVEYNEQLFNDQQVQKILHTIHDTVVQSGLFETSHIKTRAYPFRHYTHAGGDTPYVHIQARIKSGRDQENKNRLSKAIAEGLKSAAITAPVITVEIIDMERESYAKLENKHRL